MSLIKQAVSGVKWSGAATVVRVGVQFLTLAVLARLLDPEDFGLMGMALVVTGFATAFVDFGLSNAIIYRQDTTREQLSSLYWLNIGTGWLVFVLVWLAIPIVVAFYQEPLLAPVLRCASLAFLIVPFGQQFQSLLRRELRFRAISSITMLGSVIYSIAAISLAYAGYGVMSLVWAALLRFIVTTGSLIAMAVKERWLPSLHFRRHDLVGFARFGVFQMGQRSLNYLAINVDYLIIGRFLGSEALGFYTLAFNLMMMPLRYLNPVIVSVAFPAFAKVQASVLKLRNGYMKILHYVSAMTFPLLAGLFVLAPLIVEVIYGERWLPSVPVIRILCLLGAIKALGNPMGSLLLSRGRADLGFYLNVVAIIGYGISNLIGLNWGLIGVAFSSLLFTIIVLQPIGFYIRWQLVHMTVCDYFSAIFKASLASLVTAIVSAAIYLSVPGRTNILVLVIITLIGGAVYLVTTWIINRYLFFEILGYFRPTSVRRDI